MTQPQTTASRRRSRRGFSFTEVMFAVIILGIGFIMVAAIFPVAIQQTRLTVDESIAAATAKDATSQLEQLAVNSETGSITPPGPLFPKTTTIATPGQAVVYAIRNWQPPEPEQPGTPLPNEELWNRVKGSLINSADPRFAWTALYRRDVDSTGAPEPFIRVYIFVLQQRNRTLFEQRDLGTGPFAANLQPRLMQAVRFKGDDPTTNEPDLIGIPAALAERAGEGAFLVVASSGAGGAENGKVFRLGVARGIADGGALAGHFVYELDPSYNLPPSVLFPADCWMVGRGFELNPNPPNPPDPARPGGAPMDVALYTTIIKVN